MRAVKRARSIAAVFTAITLGSAAGHAHELEQVNTDFERAIPNIPGKSLLALVVDPEGNLFTGQNLISFNEVDRGGHFAASEQLQLFAEELRAAFRPLRASR